MTLPKTTRRRLPHFYGTPFERVRAEIVGTRRIWVRLVFSKPEKVEVRVAQNSFNK